MHKTQQNTNKHYRKSYQTLANSLDADQQETIKQITQIGFQIFGAQLSTWKKLESQLSQNAFEIQGFEKVKAWKNNRNELTGRNKISKANQVQNQHGTKSQRNYKQVQTFQTQQEQWISLYNFQQSNPEAFDVFRSKEIFRIKVPAENYQRKKIETHVQGQSLLKPIKNFKKKFIDSLPKKTKQQQQLEYIESHIRRSAVSLNQFYQQNRSLYDRFIQIKQNKQSKILRGYYKQIENEMQGVTFVPKLIKNQYTEKLPDFQIRKAKAQKQKEINKVKIGIQMMQNYTFQPKTNSKVLKNKAIANTESKIKQIWSKNKKKGQKIPNQGQSFVDLKGISQSMIKTGSFFSEIAQEKQQSQHEQQRYEYIYQEFPIKIKDPKNELNFMISRNGKELFQK